MTREDDRKGTGLVLDAETEHAIKNHVAVIVGFSELLLAQIEPEDDAGTPTCGRSTAPPGS